MPGLSSVLNGACPMGSQELTHTLCPAPVSALHLTPPERDREGDRKEKNGVLKKKNGWWGGEGEGREREEDKADKEAGE